MSRWLYFRMALTNLRKNSKLYGPYLLTVIMVSGIFYIIGSVIRMVNDSTMKGKTTMETLLYLCLHVVFILSIIIIFYANSFVLKQRKKELGLYHILGLKKSQIARMMFWEVFLSALTGILGGIVSGAILSQLAFLGFLRLVHMEIALEFRIPLSAVALVLRTFPVIFAAVLLYDILAVGRTKPIELLKGSSKGEREPKVKWVWAVLGAVLLGAGYAAALRIEQPSDAMMVFFPAAILVMAGTYLLFMAGSIAVLKRMKKSERFYYKPSNFITVSGMIYRMKRNVAGLASICIFSTAVILTIASCLSIFLGEEDTLAGQFPRDLYGAAFLKTGEENPETRIQNLTEKHAEEYGLTIERPIGHLELSMPLVGSDGVYSYRLDGEEQDGKSLTAICTTGEFYQQMTGETLSLDDGEAVIWTKDGEYDSDSFVVEGISFQVTKTSSDKQKESKFAVGLPVVQKSMILVVKDMETVRKIQDACQQALKSAIGDEAQVVSTYYYFFDLSGTEGQIDRFYDTYQEAVPDFDFTSSIYEEREDFYGLYGSIVFIGIFMAAMFLTATVLIMYYKQITEGYDDKERFLIMQNVGLGEKEVKQTIRKQVLLVFFLPLLTAVIHMAVAYKALALMMQGFSMYNTDLFSWCLVMTAVVFGVIYFAVYWWTAKTYYKIVRR